LSDLFVSYLFEEGVHKVFQPTKALDEGVTAPSPDVKVKVWHLV
jgi:hypothetical protein